MLLGFTDPLKDDTEGFFNLVAHESGEHDALLDEPHFGHLVESPEHLSPMFRRVRSATGASPARWFLLELGQLGQSFGF